uniref:Uncharacterized protein n=1 Tax=Meloidogyne enterolobii TaxID=390850 RepID=A0A6V7UEV9_MELEN|nr:unnamed protein product [Meloidogyne enterolobii]
MKIFALIIQLFLYFLHCNSLILQFYIDTSPLKGQVQLSFDELNCSKPSNIQNELKNLKIFTTAGYIYTPFFEGVPCPEDQYQLKLKEFNISVSSFLFGVENLNKNILSLLVMYSPSPAFDYLHISAVGPISSNPELWYSKHLVNQPNIGIQI